MVLQSWVKAINGVGSHQLSVAWVVSQEAFMKNIRWIDNLKVRLGYGVTGNQDVIAPYNSLALYAPNGVTLVNGSNTTTYAIQSNDNPDLKLGSKGIPSMLVLISLLSRAV